MTIERTQESWKEIRRLVEKGDGKALSVFLDTLPPADIARAISLLDESVQTRMLILLEPENAADVLEELTDTQRTDLFEELPALEAAAIFEEMHSDQQADLLATLSAGDAEALLAQMDPDEARRARELLSYPKDTAGGLMITEYLSYPQTHCVADVVNDMRANMDRYADYAVQYVYVVSEQGVLVGVIRLRDLVLSHSGVMLTAIMIANPIHVRVDTALDELEQLFDRHNFFGFPTVDSAGRLVGVLERAAVAKALGARADKTFMRFSGIIGGEELRSMPLMLRSGRRLAWLSMNILLNMCSAFIVAMYQGTLEQLVAIAVFLPIISDMSGCAGNQAVAVSIRELTLGLIKPRDLFRVLLKELQVGLSNGPVLGLLMAGIAFLFAHFTFSPEQPVSSMEFGMVVGVSMSLNCVVAVCFGALIPLLLKSLKFDPALAAAPLLTTVTDMCGFFMMLNFAAILLRQAAGA